MKHSFKLHLVKAVIFAVALGGMLPGSLMAQVDSCIAKINAGPIADVLYFLNEPVGIGIELGAGLVVNTDPGPPPSNYLDISKFTYYLDCQPDQTWPNCTSAGNTVVFNPASVITDCEDENGALIDFQTEVANDVVTFTPSPGQYIRNFSEQTCNISFDVTVTNVDGDNPEREIIELTGWGAADAFCDNGDPASAAASVQFDLSTADTVFWVTKSFSDSNPDPVDVYIQCNTGLPLNSHFSITQDTTVGFVVTNYPPGELDCRIWEEPVPDGYTPDYFADSTTGVTNPPNGWTQDDDQCLYENVVEGVFTCHITNTANPAEFKVTKEWIFNGEGGNYVDENVLVTIYCDREILDSEAQYDYSTDYWWVSDLLGDGQSLSVMVDAGPGAANCMASERILDSGVESNDDCDWRLIPAGGSSECTITNTVFFEGIPTLNQYGMAVLVLLMLGLGAVGFRRFA